MPPRILVTGGAGLIGSTIVDQLLTEPAQHAGIVILDDFSRGSASNLADASGHSSVEIVEGSILDVDLVDRLVRRADAVIHLAAIGITRAAADPRLANDVIVNGTFNIVEAAARHGVRKVVASSTASVYGMAEVFPTPERHHLHDNETIYGAAKTYTEGLLRSFKAMKGLDYVALRYFNVYGPRMDMEGRYTEVIARWITAFAKGESPVIDGDGSTTMDLVHVRDVARANIAALRSNISGEVFNVGTGHETSLADLAALIGRLMGSSTGVAFGPPRTVNAVPRRLADVSKASAQLGFLALIDLEEGLLDLLDWWRKTVGRSVTSPAEATFAPAGV